MKIYRLSCVLTAKGFEEQVIVFDAIEKNKTFTLTREDKWGDKSIRHKKKTQINYIDTGLFYNDVQKVEFIAFCFEDKIEEFKSLLKEKVSKHALQMHAHTSNLIMHITP